MTRDHRFCGIRPSGECRLKGIVRDFPLGVGGKIRLEGISRSGGGSLRAIRGLGSGGRYSALNEWSIFNCLTPKGQQTKAQGCEAAGELPRDCGRRGISNPERVAPTDFCQDGATLSGLENHRDRPPRVARASLGQPGALVCNPFGVNAIRDLAKLKVQVSPLLLKHPEF